MAIPAGVSHIVRRVPDTAPIHLKPAAPLAERVLLPGDPHRALAVAQALLDQPKMFNHHRGLWGYTGAARDGELLTVQARALNPYVISAEDVRILDQEVFPHWVGENIREWARLMFARWFLFREFRWKRLQFMHAVWLKE